jgi:hypothetical protein
MVASLMKQNSLETLISEYGYGYIPLNANDVFGYGAAMSVDCYLSEVQILKQVTDMFGHDGAIAFMAWKEQTDPIPEYINATYNRARNWMETHTEFTNDLKYMIRMKVVE